MRQIIRSFWSCLLKTFVFWKHQLTIKQKIVRNHPICLIFSWRQRKRYCRLFVLLRIIHCFWYFPLFSKLWKWHKAIFGRFCWCGHACFQRQKQKTGEMLVCVCIKIILIPKNSWISGMQETIKHMEKHPVFGGLQKYALP